MGKIVCEKCEIVTPEFLTKGDGVLVHWGSYGDLCRAAKYCKICYTILNGLQKKFLNQKRVQNGVSWGKVDPAISEELLLAGCNEQSPIFVKSHLDRNVLSAQIPVLSGLTASLDFSWDTKLSSSNEARFGLARYWIRESLTKAKSWEPVSGFRGLTSEGPLPARVLDLGWILKARGFLGKFIKHNIPSIRLICPKGGSRGSYVALSHRWGSSRNVLLTDDTIDSYREGILFVSLPKTFQDAVIVTLKLGYRYLWIDSLCIIQDDRQDWLVQSSRMWQIYRDAICTIAAHYAQDDDQGFLASKYPPITKSGSVLSTLHFKMSVSSFRHQINASPLSRRGWVFQERILSTRILQVGNSGLFFEDKFGVQAEDHGTEDPSLYSPWTDGRIVVQDVAQLSTDWYRLMEKYTLCSLTFESDRLPAIAGLVSSVQSYIKDTRYCSGLWLESLHQGLLWLPRDKTLEGLPSSSPYTPPSWSWAHWKGPIQYPTLIPGFKSFLGAADIMDDSDTKQDSYHAFEELNTQYLLRLRGLIKPLAWLQCTSVNEFRDFKGRFLESCLSLNPLLKKSCLTARDHIAFRNTLRGLIQPELVCWKGYPYYIGWISLDSNTDSEVDLSHISCILIAGYDKRWLETWDDDTEEVITANTRYALLLEKSQLPNRYRRVGIGVFTACDWFNNAMEDTIIIE